LPPPKPKKLTEKKAITADQDPRNSEKL